MEEQVERLVLKTWAKFLDTPKSKRLLIAVSGIPGSGMSLSSQLDVERLTALVTGKTTLASLVVNRINDKHHNASPGLGLSDNVAAFVPMDGYHLSREQLSAMPDPDTAHARRGAAFTFDASSFLELVKRVRAPLCPETGTLYAPSFDHSVKDPVQDDIPIHPNARILIFEGNYLSLGTGASEWKEAAEMMDELWFVQVDETVARNRLIARHVKSGIAKNEEEAAKRADENDLLNGEEIIQGRLKVHEVIMSREDEAWKQ